jgi:hypothetical protein
VNVAAAGKTIISDHQVQAGIKLLKSTEGVDGDSCLWLRKIDPQSCGNTEHPLAVRNLLEHLAAEPLAKFHHF